VKERYRHGIIGRRIAVFSIAFGFILSVLCLLNDQLLGSLVSAVFAWGGFIHLKR